MEKKRFEIRGKHIKHPEKEKLIDLSATKDSALCLINHYRIEFGVGWTIYAYDTFTNKILR